MDFRCLFFRQVGALLAVFWIVADQYDQPLERFNPGSDGDGDPRWKMVDLVDFEWDFTWKIRWFHQEKWWFHQEKAGDFTKIRLRFKHEKWGCDHQQCWLNGTLMAIWDFEWFEEPTPMVWYSWFNLSGW